MARNHDEQLNRLLREWLDRAEEGHDRDALQERIAQAVGDTTPSAVDHRRPDWRRRRVVRVKAALAIVAAVLVAVFVWQVKNRPVASPQPGGSDPALELLAQLDADELQRRLALLDQLDELFDDRWEWMVECGDRVDMHVAAKPQNAVSSGLVAARLVVLVRDDPSEQFRVEEKTFVLTREEQSVEATLENGVSRKLYFWAFPIDDGLFTYDVDLQTAEPHKMSIASSGVVVPRRPTKILSFEQDGSEHRVYLLLVPVPREHSGETRHL